MQNIIAIDEVFGNVTMNEFDKKKAIIKDIAQTIRLEKTILIGYN